jgi:hypothetical protein
MADEPAGPVHVVLVAMRDVSAGEELATDYALFDDDEGESREGGFRESSGQAG